MLRLLPRILSTPRFKLLKLHNEEFWLGALAGDGLKIGQSTPIIADNVFARWKEGRTAIKQGDECLLPVFNHLFVEACDEKAPSDYFFRQFGSELIFNQELSVWFIHPFFFGGNQLYSIHSTGFLSILPDGRFKNLYVNCEETQKNYKMQELKQQIQDILKSIIQLSIDTLTYLNCQNVVTVDAPEYAPPPKWSRRMKQPTIQFKTIKVKIDGGTRSKSNNERKETQDLMALHLRRGNMATYTEDAPLFGMYTGQFWRPPTLVGNAKNGININSYKLV